MFLLVLGSLRMTNAWLPVGSTGRVQNSMFPVVCVVTVEQQHNEVHIQCR